MTPRRGDVWTIGSDSPSMALVISGNMYNDLPDVPYVLAMDVVDQADGSAFAASLGDGMFAEIDTIGRLPKELLTELRRRVDTQAMTNVDNALFRILATT